MRRVLLPLTLLVTAIACDDRRTWHEPEPTLARMITQRRADPYAASRAFPDGKVMQRPPAGTVAVDDDDAPPVLSRALLAEGRTGFEAVCATCHGIRGDGDSVVATKMQSRPPPSLHEARIRALPGSAIYRVVTEGYGLMPALAETLDVRQRWAVVAYLRALHLSQSARVTELPPAIRDELARRAP